MKILHLSDTHNLHRQLDDLPEADLIIHSGDFCFGGSEAEAFDFMNWFCDLPYLHKIFIAGNHDACLDGADSIDGLPENVHYLSHSGIEIEGIKIYGVPMFMQEVFSGNYEERFKDIPDDTDLLITHQPPFSFCDWGDHGKGMKHQGNVALLHRIEQLHLRYHFFGHEHAANGICKANGTVFSNASIVNDQYELQAQPRLFVYPERAEK